MQIDFGAGDDISFTKEGHAGVIKLTRPSKLNALNQRMVCALEKALRTWETDNDISCILVKGEGRAFCAGGDVVEIYHMGRKPSSYQYFSDEYRLNAYISRFTKPYISFLNGIWMGGGVGISIYGSHRIATENTLCWFEKYVISNVWSSFIKKAMKDFCLRKSVMIFCNYALQQVKNLSGNK